MTLLASLVYVLFSHSVFRSPLLSHGQDNCTKSEVQIAPEGPTMEFFPPVEVANIAVVHIIETRFMQHQPRLIHLGMALLEQFKALCLPTIQNQTNSNFLWFIRTDPDLDPILRTELLRLVQNNKHFVVIASLTSYTVLDREEGQGFRESLDFTASDVWTGNYALVKKYHSLAQSRIMINTRLDADDGLHVRFVEHMQKEAMKDLGEDSLAWRWWCTMSAIEWQYNSPWDPPSRSGCLVAPEPNQFCVTPGLTKAYGSKVVSRDVPNYGHTRIHRKLPRCRNATNVDGETDHCLAQMPAAIAPYTIRGRTATSAGMRHVFLDSGKLEENSTIDVDALRGAQEGLRSLVLEHFTIEEKQLARTRSHLIQNLRQITEEAIQGQCRGTHSCKPTATDKLERILTSTTGGTSNVNNASVPERQNSSVNAEDGARNKTTAPSQ